MTDYPFIVMGARSRLIRVIAPKFSNALSRALSLYPNKFLQTKFARRMDLISAQEEAKRLSLKSAHKQYVLLQKDGDFEVENALSLPDKPDIYTIFHKGKKIDGPAFKKEVEVLSPSDPDEEPKVAKAPRKAEPVTKKELKQETKKSIKQLKEEVMKTEVKSAAKKAAKKVAKKVTKSAPVKKSGVSKPEAIFQSIKEKSKTVSDLAKEFETSEANIAWYVSKLKSSGKNITKDESGKLKAK